MRCSVRSKIKGTNLVNSSTVIVGIGDRAIVTGACVKGN